MQEEISRRATSDKITLLGCIMNPFTKNFKLDFAPDQRESAYSYLREEVFSNGLEVSIKKEKTDEGTGAEELEPELPSLTETGTGRTRKMKSQDVEQPSKRLKSADTEKWLKDVVCTGPTVISPESAAENEVQRYLGAKIAEGDQGLSTLEW
jgi:hypothetical protein